MKAKLFLILKVVYISIGLYFWWSGGVWTAPTFIENFLTFFYIVLAWPFVIGLFFLFN